MTEPAGLGGDRDWPTSSAFADLDGDGDLDLYVCHYVEWDAGNPRTCWDEMTGPTWRASLANSNRCRIMFFATTAAGLWTSPMRQGSSITMAAGSVSWRPTWMTTVASISMSPTTPRPIFVPQPGWVPIRGDGLSGGRGRE